MTDELIATREMPSPFDGFAHAKPGEPIFTLQGGDPMASPLVLLWTDLFRRWASGLDLNQDFFLRTVQKMGNRLADAVCEPLPPGKRDAMLLRASEAERIAWAMDEYFRGETERADDRRSSYHEGSSTEEVREAMYRGEMLLASARALDNALAEANDVANRVAGEGFETAAGFIFSAVALLREASQAIRPKRGG